MTILAFKRSLLNKLNIRASAPSPDNQQVLEGHLQKLREANQMLSDVFHNRSECFKKNKGQEICEVSIAEAFLQSSLACAELEIKLHEICKKQEISR
ncbi:MAG: hypothetical protein JAZ15_21925 [Candidatus Thiodiazotropha endolucinida]|nr:hypothetical protein [Candidatus Thiodiazotropha taylori]MCW4315676.1 hypothetical protein [Candidatus Thiodiazotropha taylori]